MAELLTDRLLLRQWRESDRATWAALNADPEVMAHFPAPLTRAQSDAFVTWAAEHIRRHGWGLWAVEVRASGEFIGDIGLMEVTFDAPFAPAVEIGWRLAKEAWGHGYATEGAQAALAHGFRELGLDEIVSFTTTTNVPSQRVMQRIGMRHDASGDFEHPRIQRGDRLCRHVLYRIDAATWRAGHV